MEAKNKLRRMTRKTEFYIFIVLIVMCIAIEIFSKGQLFAINSIIDICRSMTIMGMFALCSLMVVISGGFDLSFPTLASLAYGTATYVCMNLGWSKTNPWAGFLIAGAIGLILGMFNGFIISRYKLNTMIVTLGTQTLFLGISMGVMQYKEITSTLPAGFKQFGQIPVFEVTGTTGMRSVMPFAFIFFIILAVLVWFVLNYTMFGRSLYAIGGNETSAERAGINVKRTKLILYGLIGLLGGLIGMLRVTMVQQSIPKGLYGWDLKVIPAVILGGASIYGGEGSVFGTLVAIILITVISNSLLLIGIDSYWQDLFNGFVILAGVSISAIQAVRKGNKRRA